MQFKVELVHSVGGNDGDGELPKRLDEIHDELEFRLVSFLVEVFRGHTTNEGTLRKLEEVMVFGVRCLHRRQL